MGGEAASAQERSREFRASGAWSDRGINDHFADACYGTAADSQFVVVSGERPASLSFRELRQASMQVAAGLRSLGVEPGTRVAMQLPNWLEACLCLHACCAIGAPLVPMLHLCTPDETLAMLERSRAEVLVVPESWLGIDYSATIAAVLERSRTVRQVVVVGAGNDTTDSPVVSFASLSAAPALDEDQCVRDPDAPALICFSSGVTGQPKGVVHSHNTLMAAINAMVAGFGGAEPLQEVGLNPNPVGHGTGLFVGLVLPFLHDFRALVLLDRWDPTEMLSLMEAYRVTIVGGAPVFLSAMLRNSRFAEADTSALRGFLLGGDVISPTVVEEANHQGWPALRAYGLTEHPSISIGRPDDTLTERAYTDGQVVPWTEVRLVDENGQDVAPGAPGEILVRGAAQCIGLIAEDGLKPASAEDGWLHTGDLGERDPSGRLTIRGRLKDVIIRGGEKINCGEVESVLSRHPDVADVAVAGLDHPFMGQQVAAFVVARRGSGMTQATLARHCLDQGLAKHKVPKRLRLVDAIPRSMLGKIQRYQLVAHALDPGGVR